MFSLVLLQTLYLFFSLSPTAAVAAPSEAVLAFNTLQTWYNSTSGLWSTTGWWNSANCLTAIGDLAAVDSSILTDAKNIFSNTLSQAQKTKLQMLKVITPSYNIDTTYGDDFPSMKNFSSTDAAPKPTNPKAFLNDFYDDEGWWALGWIQAYDVTKDPVYLSTAVDIFNDLARANTTPCGPSAIWWDKNHTYVNAIANEIHLSLAAHLAVRIPENKTYIDTANRQWDWFQSSGMINSNNTINDGLTKECKNNNGTVWSYNQGVILGALVQLANATNSTAPIKSATTLATAAIKALTDKNMVLHDPCEPSCGADGSQFKGIFIRNLQQLQKVAPNDNFKKFIGANAASIWTYDRDNKANGAKAYALGLVWSGPVGRGGSVNASTQSSALDALVAAQAFGVGPSSGGSLAN